QFGSGPETVFDCPQNAVHVVPVALKLQYRINHMLEYFGTGDGAVFRDMPHNKHGRTGLFCETQQLGGTLAHLRYGAGSRLDMGGMQGLDRIDYHNIGLYGFDLLKDLLRGGL